MGLISPFLFLFMLLDSVPPESFCQFLDDAIRNYSSAYIPLNPDTVPNHHLQDANTHSRISLISKTVL